MNTETTDLKKADMLTEDHGDCSPAKQARVSTHQNQNLLGGEENKVNNRQQSPDEAEADVEEEERKAAIRARLARQGARSMIPGVLGASPPYVKQIPSESEPFETSRTGDDKPSPDRLKNMGAVPMMSCMSELQRKISVKKKPGPPVAPKKTPVGVEMQPNSEVKPERRSEDDEIAETQAGSDANIDKFWQTSLDVPQDQDLVSSSSFDAIQRKEEILDVRLARERANLGSQRRAKPSAKLKRDSVDSAHVIDIAFDDHAKTTSSVTSVVERNPKVEVPPESTSLSSAVLVDVPIPELILVNHHESSSSSTVTEDNTERYVPIIEDILKPSVPDVKDVREPFVLVVESIPKPSVQVLADVPKSSVQNDVPELSVPVVEDIPKPSVPVVEDVHEPLVPVIEVPIPAIGSKSVFDTKMEEKVSTSYAMTVEVKPPSLISKEEPLLLLVEPYVDVYNVPASEMQSSCPDEDWFVGAVSTTDVRPADIPVSTTNEVLLHLSADELIRDGLVEPDSSVKYSMAEVEPTEGNTQLLLLDFTSESSDLKRSVFSEFEPVEHVVEAEKYEIVSKETIESEMNYNNHVHVSSDKKVPLVEQFVTWDQPDNGRQLLNNELTDRWTTRSPERLLTASESPEVSYQLDIAQHSVKKEPTDEPAAVQHSVKKEPTDEPTAVSRDVSVLTKDSDTISDTPIIDTPIIEHALPLHVASTELLLGSPVKLESPVIVNMAVKLTPAPDGVANIRQTSTNFATEDSGTGKEHEKSRTTIRADDSPVSLETPLSTTIDQSLHHANDQSRHEASNVIEIGIASNPEIKKPEEKHSLALCGIENKSVDKSPGSRSSDSPKPIREITNHGTDSTSKFKVLQDKSGQIEVQVDMQVRPEQKLLGENVQQTDSLPPPKLPSSEVPRHDVQRENKLNEDDSKSFKLKSRLGVQPETSVSTKLADSVTLDRESPKRTFSHDVHTRVSKDTAERHEKPAANGSEKLYEPLLKTTVEKPKNESSLNDNKVVSSPNRSVVVEKSPVILTNRRGSGWTPPKTPPPSRLPDNNSRRASTPDSWRSHLKKIDSKPPDLLPPTVEDSPAVEKKPTRLTTPLRVSIPQLRPVPAANKDDLKSPPFMQEWERIRQQRLKSPCVVSTNQPAKNMKTQESQVPEFMKLAAKFHKKNGALADAEAR